MQDKLIALRKVFCKTQKEVADYLGIHLRTYKNKESGKSEFTSDEMFKLTVLFKKPIEDIFTPTNKNNLVYQTKK